MVAGPFDAERTDTHAQVAADRTAVRLGLLGILPFLVLSFWLAAIADGHPWRATTILLLTQYAAIVLSFLGGIRWGLALRRASPARAQELAMTMLPPLVAWASLSVPLPYTFAVLAAAFAAQGAWDAFAVHAGAAPRWYGRLRGWLTIAVVAALVLAFLATG